ncbi:EF-hand domain-containing protein [Rhodobacter ferrooxidans]|uniref:EF-hand domain-containing protein n=1 Tax=Rhodobacter ferrooxidans TaxID=371731 RepID=C8S051_9RHOB|nr:hypothetical protein [Rhodobacter sp. SW2]EEW25660.1 conserved hypothetical protein [Rhodobacter sp. SW2]
MTKKSVLTVLTLAAVTATALSTAALADRRGGNFGGPQMMGGPMLALNFDAIDADKDGKVTQAELTAHHAAQVTAADADKDGKMSVAELAAMDLAQMQARATQRAEQMVARLDSDGDGLLTAAEMATRPAPAPMLAMLDTDKDGAISKAEMEAAQARMQQGQMGRDMMGDMNGDMGDHMRRGHRWFNFGNN